MSTAQMEDSLKYAYDLVQALYVGLKSMGDGPDPERDALLTVAYMAGDKMDEVMAAFKEQKAT